MKVESSPLLTVMDGQYEPVAQPLVTPAAASALIDDSWTEPLSSEKKSLELDGIAKARTRNVAISARVTEAYGQYRSAAHPAVIPNSAILMIELS